MSRNQRSGGSYIREPGQETARLVERTVHAEDGDRPRDADGNRIWIDGPPAPAEPARPARTRRTPPGENDTSNQAPADPAGAAQE